jgi:hypothetical protein
VSAARPRVGNRELVRLALLSLFFLAAPTAGDIGGCSQPEDELEPATFFEVKKQIDCESCESCELSTERCEAACSDAPPDPADFPPRCVPLVHDGEVCLAALLAASCGDYESFVSDRGATVPSECNFCPAREP